MGDDEYHPSRLAKVDDILKVQLSVKNTNDNGHLLTGVRIALILPDESGKTQRLKATVSTGAAAVNLEPAAGVDLSAGRARLQYVLGSLKLRRNTARPGEAAAFVTASLSDTVLFRENYPLGDLHPGGDGAFSISFLMRSVATAMSIQAQVRELPNGSWSTKSESRPGASIQYRTIVVNKGNEALRETLIHVNLPPDLAYIPDSTRAVIDGRLRGVPDGIVDFASPTSADPGAGAQLGELAPGGSLTVYFDAKVAPSAAVNRTLIAVLVVRVAGSTEYYNTAHLTLRRPE